jgi:acyl-CoA thioesterase
MSAESDPAVTARRRADEMYAQDATCRDLGIAIDEVAEGYAVARMQITETMANGNGIAHGGYLFLLADTTFSYACTIRGTTLAQSAHIVFLRPASVGDELIAEAVERSRFGRIGVYDVSVRRADGTMIAEFRGQSQSVPDNFFRAHAARLS